MSQTITLYSFADIDRSGKVRWTACELGYTVEEQRVEVGKHLAGDYASLNPYRQIPAARLGGRVWCESTAICLILAERHPGSGLIPSQAERREAFWQASCVATQTLELPVVNYYLAQVGYADKAWGPLLEESVRRKLAVFAGQAPADSYWLGDFSLVDIFAAYVLRIGISAGVLRREGSLAAYLDRLGRRPAAIEARFFDSLDDAA